MSKATTITGAYALKERSVRLINDGLIVLILVGMVLFFGIANPNFFNYDNIMNILRQMSVYAIMAVGMTMVLICGEIDLTVGSIVAFAGIMAAYAINAGMGLVTATLAVMILCGAFGLASGLIVTVFAVPSMLVTMGMMMSIRGLAYVVTKGRSVGGMPRWFGSLGRDYIAGVPIPVVVMLVVVCLGWFFLKYTTYGRLMYAVGGNIEAAKLCGINSRAVTIASLVISAMLAGLGGVIWASRLNSGQPVVGNSYEMQVIAACVIGGASLRGGKGNVFMSLVGAILLGVLYNGLNLLRVSSYWQMVTTGLIIILAIVLDSLRNLKKA